MVKAILFDFDGTLVDSAIDLAYAANLQRQKRNLCPLPYEELRLVASHGARGLLGTALGITPDDPNYPEVHQSFLKDYTQCLNNNACFFDGIDPLLTQLDTNNIPWGIVTNKAENLSFPMFEHMGLLKRSKVNVCGDTTNHMKPHPAPLLLAASKLQLTPQECIYIGDDERDIIAGKAAGMKTMAVTFGYSLNKQQALATQSDFVADRPDEIWSFLQNHIKF